MIINNNEIKNNIYYQKKIMFKQKTNQNKDEYVPSVSRIDIHSKANYPGNILSNFCETDFVFDNVRIKSMEGFFQSLKIKDVQKQQEMCSLSGIEAKKASKNYPQDKRDIILHWNNKEFKMASNEFKQIIEEARKKQKENNGNKFCIDGIEVQSIDNLIQAMKIKNSDLQKQICNMPIEQAKSLVNKEEKQYDSRTLYWRGKSFKRDSITYTNLIKNAYKKRFFKDKNFRMALIATKGHELTHSIGKSSKEDTILTKEEFISNLNKLRNNKFLMLYAHLTKIFGK